MLLHAADSCIQWFKDTNLKANHNSRIRHGKWVWAVFNGSKILIWKQITTNYNNEDYSLGCIQWFKDTNLKANHNSRIRHGKWVWAVFNGSKILIWKQITTLSLPDRYCHRCIQWFKDTNLKANHNTVRAVITICQLYSMVQRY